jgi:hypothetical protein
LLQGKYYGITNEFLMGLFFLPSEFGNMVASPTSGYLSDLLIKRGKPSRGRLSA